MSGVDALVIFGATGDLAKIETFPALVGLVQRGVLTVPIGFILASAFPAMVVYAQDLMPGRTGTVSGLVFGLAFGMGSIGAAALGTLADHIGIVAVYQLCAFLPLIGLLAGFLPEVHKHPAPSAT